MIQKKNIRLVLSELNNQNGQEQTTLVRLVLLAMTVFSPNLVSLSWALSPTFKLNIEASKVKT